MSKNLRSWSDEQKKIKFIWYSIVCGIPLLIISGLLFYDYYARTDQLYVSTELYSLTKDVEGVYKSEFPRFTIELQNGGGVVFSYYYGSRKTPSCLTKGVWVNISDNQLTVQLENNSYCNISEFSGVWNVSECKTFDGEDTKCISKNSLKLMKKN